MASKVLVNLSAVHFTQGPKAPSSPSSTPLPLSLSLPVASSAQSPSASPSPLPSPASAPSSTTTRASVSAAILTGGDGGKSDELVQHKERSGTGSVMDRITQLEQNMKFLQEQHNATLVALHQEVEVLRQKNRDLQFQLVFSKASALPMPSSPSSPEDNGTGFAKSKGSPVCLNVTPLHVELLEKELHDTKKQLEEAKSENECLTQMIEGQKKETSGFGAAGEREPSSCSSVAVQVDEKLDATHGSDLAAFVKVTDAVVKRLRRKNGEQWKEIAMLKASPGSNSQAAAPVGSTTRRKWEPKSSRQNSLLASEATNKNDLCEVWWSHQFPPLPSQSYWYRRLPGNGKKRHDRGEQRANDDTCTALPQLSASGATKTDSGHSDSSFHRGRGYHNQHRDETNRRYRTRETDQQRPELQAQRRQQQLSQSLQQRPQQQYHHRRDHRERNAKSRDSADLAKEAGFPGTGKS